MGDDFLFSWLSVGVLVLIPALFLFVVLLAMCPVMMLFRIVKCLWDQSNLCL